MGLNELIKVGDNIKNYRKDLKMTQAEMADKLRIPRSTYAHYENNTREPNIETLNKIAEVLGVSSDILIGVNNRMEVNNSDPYENLGNTLAYYRKCSGLSCKDVAELTEISEERLIQYENNERRIGYLTLDVLSRVYNVSIRGLIMKDAELIKPNIKTNNCFLTLIEASGFNYKVSENEDNYIILSKPNIDGTDNSMTLTKKEFTYLLDEALNSIDNLITKFNGIPRNPFNEKN